MHSSPKSEKKGRENKGCVVFDDIVLVVLDSFSVVSSSSSSSSSSSQILLPGLFCFLRVVPVQSQKCGFSFNKICSLFSPFFLPFREKKRGCACFAPTNRTVPCCARASSSSSLGASNVGRRILEQRGLVSRFFVSSPRRSGRRSSET